MNNNNDLIRHEISDIDLFEVFEIEDHEDEAEGIDLSDF